MRTNRPSAAAPRLLLAALLSAGVTLIGACGGPAASSGTGGQAASPATPSATGPPSPVTVTRTARPSTPVTSTSTSTPPDTSLPQGWRRCANTAVGYSIGYPGDWYTTQIRPAEVCAQFHPSRFTIPLDSEYPLTALNAHRVPAPPERTDTAFEHVLLWEQVTVAGRRAVRFETSSTGEGQGLAGTRQYGYVVQIGGRLMSVHTTAEPGETGYAAWKLVVDEAARTLRRG